MKLPLTISLLSLSLLATTYLEPAFAEAPATPSASSPETITQNIKERLIETINQVNADESQSKIIGYVGKVKDIIQNTIVIEDKSGKKSVLVDDGSVIVRSPGSSSIKIDNVKIDDGIIAIGEPQSEKDEIKGKRLIVSEAAFLPPVKTNGMAVVKEITDSAIEVTPLGSSSDQKLDVTSKTKYKSQTATMEFSDLNVGDTVVFSALVNAKDPADLTATVVMQVKKTTSGLTKEVVEPSPSAKPAKSPKVSPSPEI